MARTHGTNPQQIKILQRRKLVAERYLSGKTQWEISTEVKCAQKTVSNDLAALRAEWKQSAAMDFSERRAQELAKIDRLEREYLDAWERSKLNAEIRTAKLKSDGESETSKREEGQVGDPRYLEGVRWCIAKRLEVLDLMPKLDPPGVSVTVKLVAGVDPVEVV